MAAKRIWISSFIYFYIKSTSLNFFKSFEIAAFLPFKVEQLKNAQLKDSLSKKQV